MSGNKSKQTRRTDEQGAGSPSGTPGFRKPQRLPLLTAAIIESFRKFFDDKLPPIASNKLETDIVKTRVLEMFKNSYESEMPFHVLGDGSIRDVTKKFGRELVRNFGVTGSTPDAGTMTFEEGDLRLGKGQILGDAQWTLMHNDAFILAGIAAGHTFHLATPGGIRPDNDNFWIDRSQYSRVLARELLILEMMGYQPYKPYPDKETVFVQTKKTQGKTTFNYQQMYKELEYLTCAKTDDEPKEKRAKIIERLNKYLDTTKFEAPKEKTSTTDKPAELRAETPSSVKAFVASVTRPTTPAGTPPGEPCAGAGRATPSPASSATATPLPGIRRIYELQAPKGSSPQSLSPISRRSSGRSLNRYSVLPPTPGSSGEVPTPPPGRPGERTPRVGRHLTPISRPNGEAPPLMTDKRITGSATVILTTIKPQDNGADKTATPKP